MSVDGRMAGWPDDYMFLTWSTAPNDTYLYFVCAPWTPFQTRSCRVMSCDVV